MYTKAKVQLEACVIGVLECTNAKSDLGWAGTVHVLCPLCMAESYNLDPQKEQGRI